MLSRSWMARDLFDTEGEAGKPSQPVGWDYRCTIRFGLGTGRTVLNFDDFANFTDVIVLGELPPRGRASSFALSPFALSRARA